MSKTNSPVRRVIKVVSWTVSILVILFILIVLAIRTPQVQTRLTSVATSWFESRTGAQLTIDRLYLTFRGNLQIDELLLTTSQSDTLLYSQYLEVGASLPALLEGDISITKIDWQGVIAQIKADESGTFNFQFIIDAFVSGEEQPPATSSKPIALEFGPIDLQNIHVRYRDELQKVDVKTSIDQLSLVPGQVDLENLLFQARSGSIADADVEVILFGTPNVSDEPELTSSLLPEIKVDMLDVQNVSVMFQSIPDSLRLDNQIGNLQLTTAHLDLNRSEITGELLSIADTEVAFTSSSNGQEPLTVDSANVAFSWPEWTVDLTELSIDNTSLALQLGTANDKALFIDPNLMDWNFRAISGSNIHYSPNDVSINLNELEIIENRQNLQISGAVMALLDKKGIQLEGLELRTALSSLRSDINIQYEAFDSLINTPLNSHLSIQLQELLLGTADLQQLSFLIEDQPFLGVFLQEPFRASGSIQYSPELLMADSMDLQWSGQTQVTFDGKVFDPSDSSRLKLALPKFSFASRGRDMERIKKAFDLPVDLPSQINIDGNVDASMKHVIGKLNFNSNEGKASLKLAFNDTLDTPRYSANASFQSIDLGKWLQTDQLGKVNGNLVLTGQGTALELMTSEAQLVIHQIDLIGQQMDSIELVMNLDSGSYKVGFTVDEPSIIADLSGKGQFTSVEEFTTDVQLSLKKFNLQTWELAVDSIMVSSNIDLKLKRSREQNTMSLKVNDTRFLAETERHSLKPISINLTSDVDQMMFRLTSGLFSGKGYVNHSIDELIEMSERWVPDNITPPNMDFNYLLEELVATLDISLNPTSDEFEQIWPQIDIEDTVQLNLKIDQPLQQYSLSVYAPSTGYRIQHLTNFNFVATNRSDTLDYQISFEELTAGPAEINSFLTKGWHIGDQWHNALSIDGTREHPIIKVETESQWRSDTLYTAILPESLTLDSLSWALPESNRIVYHNGHLYFYDFLLSHDNDLLEIYSSMDQSNQSLDLRFENFQLRTLTSIINASKYPATGEINGYVDFSGLEDHPTIRSDLEIKDLVLVNQPIGLLQWQSKSDQANGSVIGLDASSPDLDIKANGTLDRNGKIDLQINLNKVTMSVIEGLSNGTIQQSTGYIAGRMTITGSDSLPDYKGAIDFHNAAFVVTDINAPYSLEDESINIDNNVISFKDFTIRDEQNNLLELNGDIMTDDFTDPTFDFSVTGKNFQLLNSTAKDNELYYGKVDIDIDLKVKGRQSSPNVDVTARLNKGSNFTYILPESQLEIEEREGVVMFFDQTDSTTLYETVQRQPKILDIQGVLLHSQLVIDPETNFKMIIDKRSGDYLEIGGQANLEVNMDRKGKITVNGIYTARKGAYEVRLYEIVQRRFEVVPGSRIIWSGDPYKAELDLTAQYNLRTSVRELMEEQVVNADPTTKVSSQQDLPFQVLLRIQGSLEQPLMAFRLDMPEDVRNELGGNIYARINQINENEDELNKQVFSLIAFNQFLPSVVTNAAGGATSNIAKSSVNQILSSQLNNLSQRYIKGIDIDFNLNSIADYQSGNSAERTELSVSIKKALFDDRVIISVGNSVDIEGQTRQTNEWIDDVTIEYLLTEDGRYRIKGFQKNSFEDLVEGQVTITGLSLLFSKEFNQFRNIFNNTEAKK